MAEEKENDPSKESGDKVTDAEVVAPKKSNNMLLYILIPVILIVGIAGGFLVSSMFGGKKDHKEEATKEHQETLSEEDVKKKEALDPKNILFVPIPDLLINLKSNKQRPVFLKISLVLEIHDPKIKEVIENLRPKMVDQFQVFLRDLDTADVTGASNLQRLRQELLVRVNAVAAPYKVQDVLIKDFLVQ